MPDRFSAHIISRRLAILVSSIMLAVSSLIVPGLSAIHPAQAYSSITVNSTSDNSSTCAVSGTVCLRNAIATAVSHGYATLINFSVPAYSTFNLTSSLIVNNTNSNPITIDSGTLYPIISGQNLYTVFSVYSGANLTLNNLNVELGYNSTAGGGIFNSGTLTLNGTALVANSAFNQGGGIDNNYGTLVINNSIETGNSVTSGTVGGGFLFNYGGLVIINNSQFNNNTATTQGGAIYNANAGSLFINNSSFSTNTAPYGGALYNDQASVAISGGSFANNTASSGTYGDGGAIYNDSQMSINNVIFQYNTTLTFGGAVDNTGQGDCMKNEEKGK